MKTRLVALAALALAASACTVDNHASVQIVAICAPPEDASDCGTDGTCARSLASDRSVVYTIDSSGFTNSLQMFMQVNNQTLNNADAATGRANTNDFVIEDYVVAFGGVGAIPSMTIPAGAFTVPAEGSNTPIVRLIPEAAMEYIITNLPPFTDGDPPTVATVDLRLRGRFVNGDRLETGVFRAAVEVRNAFFPGFACPAGEVVIAICPNDGQTASITCEAP